MAEATVGKIKAIITADSSGLSQAVTTAKQSLNSLGSSAETTAGQVSKVSSALNPEMVSADVAQSTQALEVLTSSANRTEEQLSQVSEGLDGQGVVEQAGDAQHGIEQLGIETQAQTAKMEAGFKKMAGVLATAFATQKLIAFVKESVKGASDLGESINVTNEIFESGAQTVKDFAATAAKSIGQSNKTALDGANTFATFGKAAGLSGDDLSKFAIKFSGLASDLASFRNTSPEDAIQAIGAALRGESEPIRRYGVMLNEASLQAVALKEGIIKSTKEALTPQQRVLAASAAIFQQTSDAQGDFARTSDGLANSSRILSAQINDLKAGMGEALLPAVQALVGVINPLIGSFNAMDESSRQMISVLGLLTAGTILLQRGLRFLEVEMVTTAGTATLTGTAFKAMYLSAAGAGIAIIAVQALNKITGAAEETASALSGLLGTYSETAGEASLVTMDWYASLVDAEAAGIEFSDMWKEFGETKSLDGVTADIEDFDAAFNKVLEQGPAAAQALVDSLLLYAQTAEDTAPKTAEWATEIETSRELAGRFQAKIDEVTGAQAGLAALTEATTEVVLTQTDAFAGAIEEFEAYRDAVLGAARAASRDFRTGLNEAQSASQALVDSMSSGKVSSQEFENALISQSDEMLKLQFSTKGQIDKLNQIKPALRGMVDSMYAAGKAQGQTREETTALIKELGLLDGLDPRITAYLTMDISQIKAQIKEIESKLSAYRGKGSIYVNNLKDDLKGLYETLDSVNQIGTGAGSSGGGSSKKETEDPFAWLKDWVDSITAYANNVIGKNWAKGIISGSSADVADALQATIEEAIKILPNAPSKALTEKKDWIVNLLGVKETKLKELDVAKAKLTELKNALVKVQQASDSYKESIRASIAKPLEFDAEKGPLAQTQAILTAAREFKSNIAALRSAGFPTSVIQEVANAGLTNGNALAKQLLALSGSDFSEFIAAREEIASIASETGTTMADLVFGADITKAQQLVNEQTDATNDLIDTLNLVGGMIAQSVQGFQNLIGGAANALTGGTGSAGLQPTVPIPHMASGGIVSRSTLALIGESGAEAVIPLSRMGEFSGGGTTNNIVINMPPGSDGKEVVAAIQDYNRRFGPAPFNTRAY